MTQHKKYQGQLMAANPGNPEDGLYKSVILLINYSPKKAIGLQINYQISNFNLQSVSNDIGIDYQGDDPIYYGGNVFSNKIHVIHSTDWSGLSTVQISDELAVTNDLSVLAALSCNEGPEFFRACAGHWCWDNGILPKQLDPKTNSKLPHKWELAPADITSVFEYDGVEQWANTLKTSTKMQVAAWF